MRAPAYFRESPAARSLKDELKRATKANVSQVMKTIIANPIRLAEVVAGGHLHWRRTFLRGMSGLPVDDDIADRLFGFFCQAFLRRFPGTTPESDPRALAGQYLDQVEVPSPPTEAEIEASWEHTCESSPEAKRLFYRDGVNPDLPGPREPIVLSMPSKMVH